MPSVHTMRLLRSLEKSQLTSGELETYLNSSIGNLSEFNILLSLQAQAQRIAAAESTLTTILGSATASKLLLNNPVSYEKLLTGFSAFGEATASTDFVTYILANRGDFDINTLFEDICQTNDKSLIAPFLASSEFVTTGTSLNPIGFFYTIWSDDNCITSLGTSEASKDVLINYATAQLAADTTTTYTTMNKYLEPASNTFVAQGTEDKFLVCAMGSEQYNNATYTFTVNSASKREGSNIEMSYITSTLAQTANVLVILNTMKSRYLADASCKNILPLQYPVSGIHTPGVLAWEQLLYIPITEPI